jgi:hypothetical protein
MTLSPELLPLARLPLPTLLAIGGIMAVVVISWSFSHWRTAVKAAFVLALFEGAIRKWLVPQGQELVYFGKDILLIGAYLKFYLYPDPGLRAWRLNAPVAAIIGLTIFTGLSVLNPNIGSPILGLIGLKGYFMYIPMAFMMPFLFRNREELIRQATYYALLATPICLLGFLQWNSDRFSVVNTFASGMAETGATGFGFGDKSRITGTFSYLTGHSTFVLFFTGLHVALLLAKQSKIMRAWLLLNLPLLVANGLMGGSRSAIYGIALIIGGVLFFSSTYKLGSNLKALANLGVAGAVVALGAAYFFSDALLMWSTRAQISGDNVQSRVIDQAQVAIELAFSETAITGYGLGTTMPVTSQLRNVLSIPPPEDKPPAMDHEMTQVVVELGLICALAWYGMRLLVLAFSFRMFKQCRDDELRPLILVSFLVQIPYFYLSAVLNHTANFLLWGFIGITLLPSLQPAVQRRAMPGTPSPPMPSATPPTRPRGSKFPR